MKFKALAVALAAAVAAPVMAATNLETSWGTHDLAELGLGFHVTESGSFADIWSFSLNLTSDVSSTTVANNLLNVFGIANGQVSLFNGLANDALADALVGSYAFNGSTGDSATTFSALTSGNYYYRITGDLTGSLGGTYTLASSAIATTTTPPVPEPETYAMLLAGLGVVGMALRRRTK